MNDRSNLLIELENHLQKELFPAADVRWLPIVYAIVQAAQSGSYEPTATIINPNNKPVTAAQVVTFFKLQKYIHEIPLDNLNA